MSLFHASWEGASLWYLIIIKHNQFIISNHLTSDQHCIVTNIKKGWFRLHEIRCCCSQLFLHETWCVLTYCDVYLTDTTVLCFLCLCPSLTIFLYRILAHHSTYTEDKQRFLLDGLSQMQLAVTEQEHVVQNIQKLLPSQEEVKKKVQSCSLKIHFSLW